MFQVVYSWVNSTVGCKSPHTGVCLQVRLKIKTRICQSPKAAGLIKQEHISLAEITAPLSGQIFTAFSYNHMLVILLQLFFNRLHHFQNYWWGDVISSALATFLPNPFCLRSNNLESEIIRTVRNHWLQLVTFYGKQLYQLKGLAVRAQISGECFSLSPLQNDKLSLEESKYFSFSGWSWDILKADWSASVDDEWQTSDIYLYIYICC